MRPLRVAEVVEVDADRFFAKVQPAAGDECWLWTAAVTSGGYGNFTVRKVNIPAHRWSYRYFRGDPAPDLQLDHLCRTRRCVNPWHLDQVTQAVNVARGVSFHGTQTHCKRGHPLSGSNLGIQGSGYRYCRACKRVTDSRRWRKGDI